MDQLLAALGLKHGAVIGGFIGAVISLRFIEGLNAWQRATTVISGTVISAYVSPLAIEYLMLSAKLENGLAFLCGLFGMSLTGAIMKAIPEIVSSVREKFTK